MDDIRWIERFNNYSKALLQLTEAGHNTNILVDVDSISLI